MGFVPAKSHYIKAGCNQTVADPDFQMGGGEGHPVSEIRGGLCHKKKSFQLFGPHFGLKIRGGAPGSSPGPATAKFPKSYL